MRYEVCYHTCTNGTHLRLFTDHLFHVQPRQSGVNMLVRKYLDDNSQEIHLDDINGEQIKINKRDKNAIVEFVVENLKKLLIKKMEEKNHKMIKMSAVKYYAENEKQKISSGSVKIATFTVEFKKRK